MTASSQTVGRHAPVHIFVPNATYMVTAGTIEKQHWFRGNDRLRLLEQVLFDVMSRKGWQLEAWSLFSNHYHWIATAPEANGDVHRVVRELHSKSALALNQHDGARGRKVWFQYWDTCLTYENSYYARLNYVMQNPAHHGIVVNAQLYPFGSANWFTQNRKNAHVRKVESFGCSRVRVDDPFVPVWDNGTHGA
jgi:putative transposase